MKIYSLSTPEHLYKGPEHGKQHYTDEALGSHSFCGLFLEATGGEYELEKEEGLYFNCKKCMRIANNKKLNQVVMTYTIHTLGKPLETVESRTEAVWTLGSRYGAEVLKRAKESKAIVWMDNTVKVNDSDVQDVALAYQQERMDKGLRI